MLETLKTKYEYKKLLKFGEFASIVNMFLRIKKIKMNNEMIDLSQSITKVQNTILTFTYFIDIYFEKFLKCIRVNIFTNKPFVKLHI